MLGYTWKFENCILIPESTMTCIISHMHSRYYAFRPVTDSRGFSLLGWKDHPAPGDERQLLHISYPLLSDLQSSLLVSTKMSSKLDYVSDTWKDGIFGTSPSPETGLAPY